jgi:uncharacterized membrane protein (UPF0127 family)
MPTFLSPLLNERTGLVVADHLLSSFDSKTRRTGLLAHDSFPAGSAMIIVPTNAIHTFFMKFAIDLLFVSKDGRIVKMTKALRPWRMAAAWRAYGVIEMSAGAVQGTGVELGDRLVIVRRHETPE